MTKEQLDAISKFRGWVHLTSNRPLFFTQKDTHQIEIYWHGDRYLLIFDSINGVDEDSVAIKLKIGNHGITCIKIRDNTMRFASDGLVIPNGEDFLLYKSIHQVPSNLLFSEPQV